MLRLCGIIHNYIENVSRRLANLAYILYVLGCNLWIIILFLISSIVLFHQNNSILFQAINDNQLFIFLFGNILTGIINLMFNTLFATPFVAYLIIFGYMFMICGVAYFLHLKNFKIRL